LVKRGCRRLDSVPSVGTSKVTYQMCFMLRCRRCWSPVLRTGTTKSRHRDKAATAFFSFATRQNSLYRRTPTRLTPPFALPPAL
jgi:hypothetical protein